MIKRNDATLGGIPGYETRFSEPRGENTEGREVFGYNTNACPNSRVAQCDHGALVPALNLVTVRVPFKPRSAIHDRDRGSLSNSQPPSSPRTTGELGKRGQSVVERADCRYPREGDRASRREVTSQGLTNPRS